MKTGYNQTMLESTDSIRVDECAFGGYWLTIDGGYGARLALWMSEDQVKITAAALAAPRKVDAETK